jgi:hypothetical protein
MNNKNTKIGMIITNKKIRLLVGNDYFDSYSHMSLRLADNAIIFKDKNAINVYNYDCIILSNSEIYVNKNIISNNNKFIIRDEFDEPETYMVDKNLYYNNLIQVSKIKFELL